MASICRDIVPGRRERGGGYAPPVRRLAVFLLALCALAAAWAGIARADDSTVEQRWLKGKTHVALVLGTSDYVPGDVRVSFLVVDKKSRLLTAPTARLSLASGMQAVPFATGTATLVSTAGPATKAADGEFTQLFVGHIRATAPGTYFLLAELAGTSVTGIGNVIVRAKATTPGIGDPAPASQTPTLATTKDSAKLTTRTPPDRELLRVSVAQALKAHQPFVVTFATPKFCSSRTCGPVVDVVDGVRRQWSGTRVQFIHVEIYADNVPSQGPNTWVRQWKLPSEPWTFLVGADGKVKERFEGALSTSELAAAVKAKLGIAPTHPTS